jgi:hypothetical protein
MRSLEGILMRATEQSGLMFAKNTTLALGTVGDARVLRGTVSPALPLEGGVFGYVDVALRQVTRLDESG